MHTNDHVREFLRYYCHLEKAPEYAVLLTGPWGSGKTWFIRNLLTSVLPKPTDYLYVSLYGMQSFEDIESEYFRLLHPMLASKPVRLLGRLTKGILKTAISFDIDGDGKSDGSVTLGVPNEGLLERIKLSEGRLLVFDDLERCSIPIQDLLGYINQCVEHSGFKAIIIANETEILRREESSSLNLSAYRRIKEKLVGRSFEIAPELDTALDHFANDLASPVGQKAVKANLESVSDAYARSGYKNLRMLRHSLWDFDRLCQGLQSEISENRDLIKNLVAVYLAYSFEVRSGTIEASAISKFSESTFSTMGLKKDEANPDQLYIDLRHKYSAIDLSSGLIPNEVWQDIFATGSIPFEAVNRALLQSKYFHSSNMPIWIQYWHGMNLTDQGFAEVAETVENEWNSKQYVELGVVLHIAGLLLNYSKVGICTKTESEIDSEAKAYIDHLKTLGYLPVKSDRFDENFSRNGYMGFGFFSMEDPIFQGLLRYVDGRRGEVLAESYPREAALLLEKLATEPDLFMRSLILSNHEDNRFYRVPILIHLDPVGFVDTLLALDPDKRRSVAYTFKERYQFPDFIDGLRPELEWLRTVKALLLDTIEKRKGKISAYSLGMLIDPYIDEAIQRLEPPKIGVDE